MRKVTDVMNPLGYGGCQKWDWLNLIDQYKNVDSWITQQCYYIYITLA